MSELASAAMLPPDPLGFALDALVLEGALVDRAGDRATVLLPPPVAGRLSLPEEVYLDVYPERPGDTPAGLGSPLLEKLVGEARAVVPVAPARLDVEPPRPSHVRALAERFVIRNGVAEVLQVTSGAGHYLVASVEHVVEADDRREGRLAVIAATDGAEPDAELLAAMGPAADGARLVPCPDGLSVGRAARWIALRADRAVRSAVVPVLAEIERRRQRDHSRIADYFAQLGAEARSPRRRADPAAIEAKLAHLTAERDKKMADLAPRYAARVTARIAALIALEVPAGIVEIRLRRRKAERRVHLRVPAGVHSVDRLACEACGMPAVKPAACDDAVHLLCEVCAPSAQGRVACPACR